MISTYYRRSVYHFTVEGEKPTVFWLEGDAEAALRRAEEPDPWGDGENTPVVTPVAHLEYSNGDIILPDFYPDEASEREALEVYQQEHPLRLYLCPKCYDLSFRGEIGLECPHCSIPLEDYEEEIQFEGGICDYCGALNDGVDLSPDYGCRCHVCHRDFQGLSGREVIEFVETDKDREAKWIAERDGFECAVPEFLDVEVNGVTCKNIEIMNVQGIRVLKAHYDSFKYMDYWGRLGCLTTPVEEVGEKYVRNFLEEVYRGDDVEIDVYEGEWATDFLDFIDKEVTGC